MNPPTTQDTSALTAPSTYIETLPSKNLRSHLLDALNTWLHLPPTPLAALKELIRDLHNASLILDDIQDNSALRRGHAATHRVFGVAQCVNSATFMIVDTVRKLSEVVQTAAAGEEAGLAAAADKAQTTLLSSLKDLFTGQSWELKWKAENHCPSRAEYLGMVDGKTGALFVLIVRLMFCLYALSSGKMGVEGVLMGKCEGFMMLLGRYYQVRDDYRNLVDGRYTAQKGFCEDLEEKEFSFPVVVCCERDLFAREIVLGLFRDGKGGIANGGGGDGGMARQVKEQVLALLEGSGALEETVRVMKMWEEELAERVVDLEEAFGCPNSALRAVLKMLVD